MYEIIKRKRFHSMNAAVETVRCGTGMTIKRLISYDSVVCDVCVDTGAVYLYPRHRYSQSTTRQVTRFLSETLGMYIGGGDLDKVARAGDWMVHKCHAWCLREWVLGTERRW